MIHAMKWFSRATTQVANINREIFQAEWFTPPMQHQN